MRARVTCLDNCIKLLFLNVFFFPCVGDSTIGVWVIAQTNPQKTWVIAHTNPQVWVIAQCLFVGDSTIPGKPGIDSGGWRKARVAWKVAACGQSQRDQARMRAPGRESRFSRTRKTPRVKASSVWRSSPVQQPSGGNLSCRKSPYLTRPKSTDSLARCQPR